MSRACAIIARASSPVTTGEGDHPKGGGGGRRLSILRRLGRNLNPKIGAAAAPSTAFGGPPPPRCGGGCARPDSWSTRRALALAAALLAASLAPAAAQKSKGGAVLPGGNSGKPINIEAVKLDYFDKEQKLIYTGNVVATQGDSKLKASVLTIWLVPKGASSPAAASSNQVQRMVATGPVTMLQRDQVGTGDTMVYERLANNVVLTGNVTLSQGPNVTKGDRLTYDLKTGQAVVTGRVKSMFLPNSQPSAQTGGEASDDASPHRKGHGATAAAGARGM